MLADLLRITPEIIRIMGRRRMRPGELFSYAMPFDSFRIVSHGSTALLSIINSAASIESGIGKNILTTALSSLFRIPERVVAASAGLLKWWACLKLFGFSICHYF